MTNKGISSVIVKRYRVENEQEQAEIMPQVIDYFKKTFHKYGEKKMSRLWVNETQRFRYHKREYSIEFEESSKKVQVTRGLEMIVGEIKITIRFPPVQNKLNGRLMRRIQRDLKLPFNHIDVF